MSTCLGGSLRDARGGAAAKRAVKGESPCVRRHINQIRFPFSRIPAATGYLLVCLLCSFQHALAAPCRVHVHDCWVPRDGLLASGRPSFGRVPVPYSISGRKRPNGRPRSTAGRLLRPGRFLQMHVLTHNEHPSCGLSDTSLRSRPIVLLGRHVMASPVPRPGAPRPAEDQPRPA